MKVWVFSIEYNRSIGGEPNQVVSSVHATKESANAADLAYRETTRTTEPGCVFWGDETDADGNDLENEDWDYDTHVEAFEVHP